MIRTAGIARRGSIASSRSTASTKTVLWTGDFEENSGPYGPHPSDDDQGGNTTLPDLYVPETGAFSNYGGGEYNSNGGLSDRSTDFAHTGTASAKLTQVNNYGLGGVSSVGVRLFRWRDLNLNRQVFCEGWFYIPTRYTLTHDPSNGQFFNLFQFKSRDNGSRVDPFWFINCDPDSNGIIQTFALIWGGLNHLETGPHSGDPANTFIKYTSSIAIPVGTWFRVRAMIKQSNTFDGKLRVWITPSDGAANILAWDFDAIKTGYQNTAIGNAWEVNQSWSCNFYTDGIAEVIASGPKNIYIDDMSIYTDLAGATVPQPPTGLSATGSYLRFRANFSPPSNDGGDAVIDYRVTATPQGGGASVQSTNTASPVTVSGLTNGVTYDWYVQARNGVGYSANSSTSSVTVVDPPYFTIARTATGTATQSANTTSHSISRPVAASAGNVAEVAIVVGTGSGGPGFATTISSVSTGWTLIAGPITPSGDPSMTLYRYRRVLDGTSTDTFTATTVLGCVSQIVVATYSNLDTTTQQDVGPATIAIGGSTTGTVGSITTVTDKAMAITAVSLLSGSTTVTPPAGPSQAVTVATAGVFRLSLFEELIGPFGSTGTRTYTYSASRESCIITDAQRPLHT